ncbi:MCE family protein [Mycolicibacterium cosmeticum]|uniref:Virulence factor Mce family protein n=1 Tax=Mycolicibacterium cosmeticum TaxID=258533 RepID=W9AND6_MYCCO|nr:MCE family protein [Mycolicibacterium cosmeticum]TLH80099.1 MCE family protein [Mycolicibacterium cosmeticum]CDO07254.1 virulence factor Mce family protein [Mycolicibacterium cosmeticum]
MTDSARREKIDPIWYAPILFVVIGALIALTALLFNGTLRSFVPVTLVSDRAGLVMENGAKVKLRGIQIGEVGAIGTHDGLAALDLKLDPGPFAYLPSNVEAEIKSSTAFGAKYVDLIIPDDPSSQPLRSGAVLQSRNVTVEVNTVFENLQSVVHAIDPAKLNSVLSAVAQSLRGKGDRIGEAITSANNLLLTVNPRMPTVQRDWQLFGQTTAAYSAAAQDILSILDSAATTSTTITTNAQALDTLLLSAIGFARSGIDTVGGNQTNLVRAMNILDPTTNLLLKYSPTYTCLFQGAQWFLEHGGRDAMGGNGKSVIMDAAMLAGDDPYRFPDNLPIVNAKGGPGGKPGCGSLPDVSKNFPVKYLVTDTGFGTGPDIRTNPGIGFPGWANYLPVTRAVPEPPSIRYNGPPAPGPFPPQFAPGPPPPPAPETPNP